MRKFNLYIILIILIVTLSFTQTAQSSDEYSECKWTNHIEEYELTEKPFIYNTYYSFTTPQIDFLDMKFTKIHFEAYSENQPSCEWYVNDNICLSLGYTEAGVFETDCVEHLEKGMNQIHTPVIDGSCILKKVSISMKTKSKNC